MVAITRKRKPNHDDSQNKKSCIGPSSQRGEEIDKLVDDDDNEVEECLKPSSKSTLSRERRGETQMHCLAIQRVKGVVKTVNFNALGQPIGEEKTLMQSYIGYLVRKEVKITYKSWKDVPQRTKDLIWDSVNMLFKVEPSWKPGCLKSANSKWRQFKTELTNDFVFDRINDPEELNKRPRPFIDQSDWSEFVISRLSEEFKSIRKKQQERRKLNIYPHRLSRKGYAGHAEEIADQLSDDEEVNRARLWISARQTKEGKHEGEELNSVVAKIDEYIQEKKDGNSGSVDQGPNDGILCKALQSKEHAGRVRGVGGDVTPTVFFGLPRGSKREDKKLFMDQQKELLETKKKNSELDARLKKLEEIVYKNASSIEIEEKASCSVKSRKYKSPDINDQIGAEQEGPSYRKDLFGDEDVQVLNKDETLQGELVALTLESCTEVAAYGTIVKVARPNNCMCVAIDQAVDEDAFLPFPGECQSIGEAVGSHVDWPKHLIKLKDKKPKRERENATEKSKIPTLDSASMPKTLHILYCYVKLALEHKGNLIVHLDTNVYGHDRTLYINMEDITPFCQLQPISYTCMSVYIWHLYKKLMMTENKLDKYRFVDPYNIGYIPSTKQDKKTLDANLEQRSRALVSRLSGTRTDQLVLAPCNVGGHWILTIINPHKGAVHLLDPLYRRNHDKDWKHVVDTAIRMFNTDIQKSSRKQPTWEMIKEAPLQPDAFQCGYFVMRYMRQIVYQDATDDATLRSIFTNAVYSPKDIDEVRTEWAECIQEHI